MDLLPQGTEPQAPAAPSPVQQISAPVVPAAPSPKQQSWGVLVSIVVIVLMIVVGAFYAWGQRIETAGLPQEVVGGE